MTHPIVDEDDGHTTNKHPRDDQDADPAVAKRVKYEEHDDDDEEPDATALAADIAAAVVNTTTTTTAAATATVVAAAPTTTTTTTWSEEQPPPPDETTAAEAGEMAAALERMSAQALQSQPNLSDLITQQLWSHDAATVEQALHDLADLSYGHANASAHRVAISVTGGLLAIVKAIDRAVANHESRGSSGTTTTTTRDQNAAVVAAGGRALQNLALDQNCKGGIVRAGGVTAMVRALQTFGNVEGVALGGCGLWQNLVWGCGGTDTTTAHGTTATTANTSSSSSDPTNHRLALLHAGVIPCLLQALEQFPHSTDVQEWGCGALFLLSLEPAVRDALLLPEHNNTLVVLATALQHHSSHAGIWNKARNALARLLWQY